MQLSVILLYKSKIEPVILSLYFTGQQYKSLMLTIWQVTICL